jgi:hypothetical protein
MPDGPRHDDDFYAWTQYQASVLRAMPTSDNRFDRAHVAEEIEDLGKSERDAVRSQMRRILEHFLKLQFSPAAAPRLGWLASIAEARSVLGDKLSPTLRHDLETRLVVLYNDARYQAELALLQHDEATAAGALPVTCPYSLDQILAERWYPEPEAP